MGNFSIQYILPCRNIWVNGLLDVTLKVKMAMNLKLNNELVSSFATSNDIWEDKLIFLNVTFNSMIEFKMLNILTYFSKVFDKLWESISLTNINNKFQMFSCPRYQFESLQVSSHVIVGLNTKIYSCWN